VPDGLLEYAAGLYASLWPALLGAVIALYVNPGDGTRADRLFSGVTSVAVAVLFAPAIVAHFAIESPAIANAIHGAFALFGLTAAGQVMTAIREFGLPALLREFVRRFLPGAKG
jgi:hypothetical protein